MYDERTGIRLAQANMPIRAAINGGRKVWVYVPEGLMDELVSERPESYLAELERWKWALYNQDFFCVIGKSVYIACSYLSEGGRVEVIEFECEPEDGYLRIVSYSKSATKRDWVMVKTESRRIRKGRLAK